MLTMLLKLGVFIAVLPLLAAETLSLEQAVALAIDGPGNFDVQLARTGVAQAEAQTAAARALLLPALGISATEQNQSRNLSAEGFRFENLPGFRIPAQVGPYDTFDSRASLQQTVFNASLLVRKKAFEFNTKAQKLAEQQTREIVAARVAHAYLEILRHRSLLAGIEADVEFAGANVSVARERLDAGKAIPVDVATAISDLRNVRILQSEEEAALAKAQLNLLDVCNLELTNTFETAPVNFREDVAATPAVSSRPDIASAQSEAESARLSDRALVWERLPTVNAYADAGVFGGVETHTIGVSVNLPVFDGGRRAARRAEAISVLTSQEIKVKQLRRKAQVELRKAELDILAARRQFEMARDNGQAASASFEHAKRMVQTGGFDRVLEFRAKNRKKHADVDEAVALLRLQEALLAKAEASGSVLELIGPARRERHPRAGN
jgi:outer membrane protein